MRPVYVVDIEHICRMKWYTTDVLTEPCFIKRFVTPVLGVLFLEFGCGSFVNDTNQVVSGGDQKMIDSTQYLKIFDGLI